MPKVSVIVPVYNVEKYLRKCLDSVCNQTLKDIEIICINDCSQDNSLEILKEYASKDKKIKIINFKQNQGVAVARNEAIKIARGEYIAFCDSDDSLSLNFCEALYYKAKKDNAQVVLTKSACYSKFSYKNITWLLMYSIALRQNMFIDFCFWAEIYERKLLQENKIEFIPNCSYGEDRIVSIKAQALAKKVSICNEAYYLYNQNLDSVNHNIKQKYLKDSLYAKEIAMDFINKTDIPKKSYIIICHTFIRELLFLYNQALEVGIFDKELFEKSMKLFKNSKYSKNIFNKEIDTFVNELLDGKQINIAKMEKYFLTKRRWMYFLPW